VHHVVVQVNVYKIYIAIDSGVINNHGVDNENNVNDN